MTTNTFAAQAERRVQDILTAFRAVEADDLADDMMLLSHISDVIKAAQHFVLPDKGLLMNDEARGAVGLPLRLPHPAITLSYVLSDAPRGEEQVAEPGRMIVGKHLIVAQEQELDENLLSLVPPQYRDSFRIHLGQTVIVAAQLRELGPSTSDLDWTATPFGWILPPTLERAPYSAKGDVRAVSVDVYTGVPFAFRPGMLQNGGASKAAQARGVSKEQALLDFMGEATAIMVVVLEVLEALACSNVHAERNRSTPPAVNARRIRDGKTPLYDDWVLTIDAPTALDEATGEPLPRGAQSGRASPRQHLRRGHIRIYKATGKRVWINAMVVSAGSDGTVTKTYRLLN